MSDPVSDPVSDSPRRRATDPFGDVLPERDRDDDPRGWGDQHGRDRDDWLRDEVPPHHG